MEYFGPGGFWWKPAGVPIYALDGECRPRTAGSFACLS